MKECPDCHRCFEDCRSRCAHDGVRLVAGFSGSCLIDRRYLLLRRIGIGGMGKVYRARHVDLERDVAIKLLRTQMRGGRSATCFREEARLLARIRHPHVVEVSDFGVESGRGLAYLVMEHVAGRPLSEYIRPRSGLPLSTLLPIAEQIAAAVDALHRVGVVHCDLKPSNILLTRSDGGRPRVKLIDFGVARRWNGSESAGRCRPEPSAAEVVAWDTGMPSGTPAYMAPELFDDDVTPAVDVYGFGVLLYELATGRRPFRGSAAELAVRHLSSGPPTPSLARAGLACELDAPLLAPLAKSAAERPPSAAAAVAALRAAGRRLERRRRWPKRMAAAIHLALGVAVLTFVL